MSKKKKKPFIVKLAILTTVTTFIWIATEVYRALTIKPPPDVPAEILLELDPNLDLDALSRLQQRLYLENSEIQDTRLLKFEDLFQSDIQETEQTTEIEQTPAPEPEATGEATPSQNQQQ